MTKTLTLVSSPGLPKSVRRPREAPKRPRCFRAGRDTVDTEAELALPNLEIGLYQWVMIKADSKNKGQIYVGRVGVKWDTGFELAAGDEIEFEVDNLNSIYVIASRDAQAYCWFVN